MSGIPGIAKPARSPAEAEILLAEELRVEAGGRVLLDVDRLGVRDGEVLALLGPNGAGKSTLLRVLAGLQRPDGGRIVFDGRPGREAVASLRRRSASVFQRPHLWAGSVRRNLELGLRLRGVPGSVRRGRAEATAVALGLESLLDSDARTLSGGEAQRVALGRALALEPDVLFLDEPTANLDAEVRSRLREDLDRVARSRARAIVLATHDRSEAFFLADRIVILREGREVQTGSPGALFENPSDPFIANVTGAELALRGTVEQVEGTLLGVRVAGMLLAAVAARGPLAPGASVKLAYRPEDLFLAREAPAGVSARNRFQATIQDVRSLGGLVRVRLRGPGEMGAVVTRAAAEELELRAGSEIFVQIKATALHAFALAPEEKTADPSTSPNESGERG